MERRLILKIVDIELAVLRGRDSEPCVAVHEPNDGGAQEDAVDTNRPPNLAEGHGDRSITRFRMRSGS